MFICLVFGVFRVDEHIELQKNPRRTMVCCPKHVFLPFNQSLFLINKQKLCDRMAGGSQHILSCESYTGVAWDLADGALGLGKSQWEWFLW